MRNMFSVSIKTKSIVAGIITLMSISAATYETEMLGDASRSSINQMYGDVNFALDQLLVLQQKVSDIHLDVVQVQQYLQDISATRGQDGLDDGPQEAAKYAAKFYSDINAAITLADQLKLKDMKDTFVAAKGSFPNYYETGKAMSAAYVKDGPAGGNKMMSGFDAVADHINKNIDDSITQLDSLVSQYREASQDNKMELEKQIDTVSLYAKIFGGVSCAAILYLLILLGGIVRGLLRTNACISAAARGDINQRIIRIKGNDELARTERNLNRLLDLTESFLKESENCLRSLSEGFYYRRILEAGLPGAFARSAKAVGVILAFLKSKEEAYQEGLKGMTDNFDKNITAFIEELMRSSAVLEETSNDLTTLSQSSLAQSSALSEAAQVSSSSVGVVASTTEQLSSSIKEINAQLNKSTALSSDAVHKSKQAETTITTLQESAAKIGDIVGFIQTIAGQTNLLALNATIEAARAGEAGKGFAVVASEVKALANKTTAATTEISNYVSNVMQAISASVAAMNQVGLAINEINETTGSIAAAMEEQSSATGEILRSMQGAATSAQKTQESTDIVADTARRSQGMAQILSKSSVELVERSRTITGELETFLSNLKAQ